MLEIAARLRACRARSGLTYRAMSRETGLTTMSTGHISDCHNGRRTPSLEQLVQFARVYRTTVEWLRYGKFEIDIWSEFKASHAYRATSSPTNFPGSRVGALLSWVTERYAGHMCIGDIERYADISASVLGGFISGQLEASTAIIGRLAELTGVPPAWLQVGDMYHLTELPQVRNIDLEYLMRWLTLGHQAYALNIPISSVETFLQSLAGAQKGRA